MQTAARSPQMTEPNRSSGTLRSCASGTPETAGLKDSRDGQGRHIGSPARFFSDGSRMSSQEGYLGASGRRIPAGAGGTLTAQSHLQTCGLLCRAGQEQPPEPCGARGGCSMMEIVRNASGREYHGSAETLRVRLMRCEPESARNCAFVSQGIPFVLP